jgi:tetratricopeptide (TPR) repeat protein
MSDIETSRELLDKAKSLRDAGQILEAADTLHRLFKQFKNSADPAVQELVAESMFNLGLLVRAAGNPQLAAVNIISALYNKGVALFDLGRLDAAIDSYEETLRQADAYCGQNPVVANYMSGALLNLGAIYARSGLTQKALDSLNELVRRFANESALKLKANVAHALYNKAVLLVSSGSSPQAADVFKDVVDRFSDAPEAELQHWAGMAQYDKAMLLFQLGQVQDSVAASEEMVRLFGSSTDPAIRVRLAKALYHRALIARVVGVHPKNLSRTRDRV